jgi:hypothetical protein
MLDEPILNSIPTEAHRTGTQSPRTFTSGPKSAPPDPSRRKCFVISPIGADGSPVRKHMDDVFHCLIEPACKRTGFDVYRGDHKARPGRITNHIISSILDDDIIICVLTGANPNVYYELAIAESAGRPIVVLKQRDEPIPFDVKDVRIIEYDLDPRRVYEETYVDQIEEAIQSLEADGLEKCVVPFAPRLSPLGADSLELRIARQYGDVSNTEVLKVARAATNNLDICGLTLQGWTLNEPLCGLIEERGSNNQQVRLLVMDKDNPALPQMLDGNPSELERVTSMLARSLEAWSRIAARFPSVDVRCVTKGIVYQQAVISDVEMIWVPHLCRFGTKETPSLRVMPIHVAPGSEPDALLASERPERSSHRYFLSAMQAEFDALWYRNGGRLDRVRSKGR